MQQVNSKKNIFAKKNKSNIRWCWIFMIPTLLLYLVFTAWPIFSSFYYATLKWSGLSVTKEFVGLSNFIEVAKDPYFWSAFWNSFKFMFGVVPIHLIIGLLLAVVLNNKLLKLAKVYRTLFFLPVVTTASIVGIIMIFILGADGPVNTILLSLGITDNPINWLGDPKYAMISVILISGWKNLGINMIYWLAALQSIPSELYEAAKVDGCNSRQMFRYITFPLIIPIGAVIALLNIVGSLKVFDIVKTMTNGGPFFSTDVVATYIYRYAFSSEMGLPRIGYASAAGIFFGITIIIVGFTANHFKKKIKAKSIVSQN
ncbi:sugar ABC transporter permease [Vallitalea longa]|uniref:Sugar ABC transporter permease n=1 Tax=Vallitalea longa TaxID=2936439 RepID=A0A9W5YDN5_9FIRM|nr:sugar ABC transporter permease [Vallitalea longa]GKX30635.1 sugar ABC transporter permease [Vallitalea longa]